MKNLLKTLVMGTGLGVSFAATPCFAVTTPSQAWYAGASGDITWMGDSDTGGGGNINMGYRFKDVRAEAEVGYHDASGNNGEHYWAYMGNLYYDFNNMYSMSNWNVSPYIGAGLGDVEIGGSDSEFGYQGMVGLNFASVSTPRTTYRLGYRYLGTTDNNPEASNMELGVNYAF